MTTPLSKRLGLLASAVSILALIALIAIIWFYARVRASLPQLEGRAAVAGLSGTVAVERDSLGVPTIKAPSRTDVARALGFLHAQDRFFQMDIWRRSAAGELSAVFGQKTFANDRRMRIHGFRKIAEATLAQLPSDQRAIVEAYTVGVNAGLAALHGKPFEYLLVRATPEPWKPEDTFLVCAAMLVDLQDANGQYERSLMTIRDEIGRAGVAFFAPLQTPADAALDGTTEGIAPIPGPQLLNLRGKTAAPANAAAVSFSNTPVTGLAAWFERDPEATNGSNAFALARAHTATGAALLASDIHLTLRVPNVWYRASFEYPGHKVTGITLPGVPLMIAGSNGKVAWSFTNAYADTGDLIAIDTNPISEQLYRAPGHEKLLEIETRREEIRIEGEPSQTIDYEWTIWGPIVAHDDRHRPLSYLWTGHDPAATNLALIGMEDASDVTAAVEVAHRTGMPAQNMIVADAAGDIAWTIAGRLPRRVGYDGRLPVTFQFADRKWDGYLGPEEVPVVTTKLTGRGAETAAPDGRIWSANQRMVGGAALARLGDGGYARPNRAAQLRDRLAAVEHATPQDLLALQLDDRALFLEPWNKLLLDVLSPEVIAEKEVRGVLREYAAKWEGRASVDAVSYPITRMFRIAVCTRAFSAIFASCSEANPQFSWGQVLLEGAVWKLLDEKPAHLLAPQYASWNALLVAAVDDVVTQMNRAGIRPAHATWGKHNTAEIRHPLSYSLPWFIRSRLDMLPDQLPGDIDMPRVQTPTHGASERFVVSPGHENEGIMHLPCGQSGHPLSPYYRAGHDAWVRGEPTPFLPGKPEHTLTLQPR